MEIKAFKNKDNQSCFSIYIDENNSFSSNEEEFPFFGNFDVYRNKNRDVHSQIDRFFYLNKISSSSGSHHEEEKFDTIKSKMVDSYISKVIFLEKMLNSFKSGGDSFAIDKKISVLNGDLESVNKSIDETIKLFENDSRKESIPDGVDINDIKTEDLKQEYSKQLRNVKLKIQYLKKDIQTNFARYIKAFTGGIFLTACEEFKKDVVFNFCDNIDEELSSIGFKFFGMNEEGGELSCFFKSEEGSKIEVCFDKDMCLRNIFVFSLPDMFHMSQSYFNSVFLPIFKAVGHYRLDGSRFLLPVEVSDGSDDCRKFRGFDIEKDTDMIFSVSLHGDTAKKTVRIAASKEIENQLTASKEKKIKEINSSKMMRCTLPGTKYDGVAGEVIHDQIKDMGDFFEVPLKITFDSGKTEVVFFDSDKLAYYL